MAAVLEANRGTLWPSPDGVTLQEFIDWTIGRMRSFLPGTRSRISSFYGMRADWELVDPPRRPLFDGFFELSDVFQPADRIAFQRAKEILPPHYPPAIAPNATS